MVGRSARRIRDGFVSAIPIAIVVAAALGLARPARAVHPIQQSLGRVADEQPGDTGGRQGAHDEQIWVQVLHGLTNSDRRAVAAHVHLGLAFELHTLR